MSDPPASATLPAVLLLEQALDSTQASLRHYIQRLVRDGDDTLDIVQEAYVAAVQAARRHEPPFVPGSTDEPIRRWLFHASYCLAMSLLRHRRVVDITAQRMSTDELPPSGNPQMVAFETRIAEADALRVALEAVDPQDASLLLLRVVHRYTSVEIAQSLGISPAAVRQRLSRTLRNVRDVYTLQNDERAAAGGRG
jgi:RNA polymerase sigma factor (sigma-70 family)